MSDFRQTSQQKGYTLGFILRPRFTQVIERVKDFENYKWDYQLSRRLTFQRRGSMMSELSNLVINFIRTHQIDSVRKLHLLLFFQRCPQFQGNVRDIASKLYLADTQLVNRLILDLKRVGLIVETDCCWTLSANPEVIVGLELLARSFERPLTRQKLLDQLKGGQTERRL